MAITYSSVSGLLLLARYVLSADREAGNAEDPFAIAVFKDGTVVGHIPHKYLKLS